MTHEEFRQLNPGYDPGPQVGVVGDAMIRHYLGVEDKRRVLEPYFEKTPKLTRLLDIGCGAGGYLLAAQELGCEAVGVEPSASHASVGRSLGLDVRDGYFEPTTFPPASFDLVVLSHVIEHIYEPMGFLRGIMPVVREGGTLIVMTPNSSSIVALLSLRYWVMLKPVDHVSMLSERSLRVAGAETLGELHFSRSEYQWEVLASLASAARTAIRGNGAAPAAPSEAAEPEEKVLKNSGIQWDPKRQARRLILAIAGLPLHLAAKALDREACLTMSITKRAGDDAPAGEAR